MKRMFVLLALVLAVGMVVGMIGCQGSTAEQEPAQELITITAPSADCDAALDPNAAILSSGFGLNPSNTRNSVSSITASNVHRLRLRFALGGLAEEKRGAPAVTEQALFYVVGNQIVAAARSTGCTFWTAILTNPDSGATEVPRSSSILLVDNPSGGRMLFVGARSRFVYGLDAADGSTLWSARLSTDPMHIITGGMQFNSGRLFVPVATGEVIEAAKPGYPCCSSRADASSRSTRSTATSCGSSTPFRPEVAAAACWSALSIDPARNQLFLGVGQNLTQPATAFSDSIVAIDLDAGAVNWWFQATARAMLGTPGANSTRQSIAPTRRVPTSTSEPAQS